MKEGDGAVLVFLTGWDEISKLVERLKANSLFRDSSRFLLLPLHGSMPTINQREIFQRPPSGVRWLLSLNPLLMAYVKKNCSNTTSMRGVLVLLLDFTSWNILLD